MSKLLAGAGKAEILFPEEIFPLEGFYKVHDNPQVRILCMDKGTRFVIAAFELVMLPDDLLEECKEIIASQLGVKKENVWIHVTHAITTPHSPGGPLIGPGGEVRPIPEEWKAKMNISIEQILAQREIYFRVIKEAVHKACAEAANLRETRIGVGKGICNINENRDIETPNGWWIGRHGKGYSNKEMTVIQLIDNAGKKIAGVISYGIKSCVIDNSQMMEGKRQISADLTGVACRQVEAQWNAPVLFLMSAAGDQIPKQTVFYDEVDENGSIHHCDLGVALGLKLMQALGHEMAEDVLAIGRTIICEELSSELSCACESFEWEGMARNKVGPTTHANYTAEGKKRVHVGVLKMGSDIALVATRPEMNAVSEKQLQDGSPVKTTLLVTMVDGGMKYMPGQDSFDKVTWEALNSMLMPGAAEVFVDRAVSTLRRMEA